ncbi:hypothetical protein SISNIDRAFT_54707 [Sistotremastrum niveocremeum HHB9708]|uniref:Uncharacterized protein n=1 Tax=Sistotremastrum niveocremeum HHB9708 TaxID=1314777 RepID=A0A164VAU0_9AGAM|nr:hypothetical protein SISNIDRAFT_54707 [Sistotremastrum niveocremeum HHB9708]
MYKYVELLDVLGSDSDERRLEARLTWRLKTNMSQLVTGLEVSNKSKRVVATRKTSKSRSEPIRARPSGF